jgi:hypothetical protein
MVSHSLIFLLAAISGMSDDQVYQRGDRDQAVVRLSGTAPAAARTVEARVLRQYYAVAGLDWTRLAEVRSGQWEGSLALPTGGPYRVEFRAEAAEAARRAR